MGGHSPALLRARHSSDSLLSLTYYKVLFLTVDLHRVDRVEGWLSWILPLGLPRMKNTVSDSREQDQRLGDREDFMLPRAPVV